MYLHPMIAIVRIALSRPYTFVVLAVLILIFGVSSAIETPTDILPNIGIPVVAAVWTYNGMPPDDMSGRVVYYYERTLSSQVNDIEHIESQSLFGYGIVKIFFQPSVNINAALAQVTAASQTVLKQLPPGITPPYILAFSASSVPILQLALSSGELSQSALFDQGQNFIRPQLATIKGAAVPSPYGGKVRQIQIDLDQHALQSRGLSAQDVVDALARQNIITPVGTEKIGKFEWDVHLNDAPTVFSDLSDLPIKQANGTNIYMRDVAQVRDGSPPQVNVVHVDGNNAVLMTILKAGSASTLDIINGNQGSVAEPGKIPAEKPQSGGCRRPVGLRQIGSIRRDPGRAHRRQPNRPDDFGIFGELAVHPDYCDLDPTVDSHIGHHARGFG